MKRKYHPLYSKQIKKQASRKKSKIFETKITFDNINQRSKHAVLGKSQRGTKQDKKAARNASIAKRKESLIMEFQNVGKDNSFTDLRFGENDQSISVEDKALARFTTERKKRARGYNLGDDEDELTHFGQSLSSIAKGDLGPPVDDSDEDSDQGRMDAATVARFNFGGGEDHRNADGSFKKTKKEAMLDLMKKSKFFRMEKQEQRSKLVEMADGLDAKFSDLRKLLNMKPTGMFKPDEEMDDFSREARMMAMDMRAPASERLLSPEEAATKEMEKLKALEQDRQERMSDRAARKASRTYEVNDESLESNFIMTADYRQHGQHSQKAKDEDEDDSDEDIDGSDVEEAQEDDDESNRKEVAAWLQEDKQTDAKSTPASEELPFTFSVPRHYGDYRDLVRGRTQLEQRIILERMVACNHPSISPANGALIQRLFSVLLDHIEALCLQAEHRVANNADPSHLAINLQKGLDVTQACIYDLAHLLPSMACRTVRKKLCQFRNTMLENGSFTPHHLIFFKLASNVFPTSDFRHGVITPCLLMMAESLSRSPVQSLQDVCSGLMVSSLLLHYISLSKRLIPELPAFLSAMLIEGFGLHANSGKTQQAHSSHELAGLVSRFAAINIASGPIWQSLSVSDSTDSKVPFSVIFGATGDTDTPAAALNVLCNVAIGTAKVYKDVSSVVELFTPFLRLSEHIQQANTLPDTHPVARLKRSLSDLLRAVESKRRPLTRGTRVHDIKTFTPAFVDTKTLRTEQDQTKIMKKKVKREKAGAMKELRKDALFLAQARQAQMDKKDASRERKRKEIMHMLEKSQHDSNILSGKTKAPKQTKKDRRASKKNRTYGQSTPQSNQ